MPAGLCFPPEAGLHSLARGPFSIFQVSSWVESFSRGITLTSSPVFSTLKGPCDYTGSSSVGVGTSPQSARGEQDAQQDAKLLTPDWHGNLETTAPGSAGRAMQPSWRGDLRCTSGIRGFQPARREKERPPPIVSGRRGRPKAILSFTSHSLWENELSTEYSLLLAGQGGAGLFFTGKA